MGTEDYGRPTIDSDIHEKYYLQHGREYFSDNMLTSPESSSTELRNNCGYPFGEDNFIPANPAEALGDLLHESSSPMDDSYLCQACKEELGMLNLMGFGE